MREPAPFVTRWRSRTVANGDSIRFAVLRCFQCSAGKSKNVSSTSASFSRVATAWRGYAAVGTGSTIHNFRSYLGFLRTRNDTI